MQLKEYWIPKVQDIEEFQKIAEAEQPEVNAFKQKTDQFTAEIIVATATNTGLSRYENMLGLGKLATHELRVASILQNLNNSLPFTYKYLKNLLDSVVGEGQYYLSISGYHLELGVLPTKSNIVEMLKKDLRKKIPANMDSTVKILEETDVNCYVGIYIQTADVITI